MPDHANAPTHQFDIAEFASYLNETRIRRGMSWRAVGRQTGVISSTLSRLGMGRHVDVDVISTLAVWAGLELGWFVRPATSGSKEHADA